MTEYVSLKKEDLLEAWEKGCPDVRNTLEFLYPDDLPPKRKEKDVTSEVEFKYIQGNCFIIKHDGKEIARQWCRSNVEETNLTISFFLNETEGYRFEIMPDKNWRVIKENG